MTVCLPQSLIHLVYSGIHEVFTRRSGWWVDAVMQLIHLIYKILTANEEQKKFFQAERILRLSDGLYSHLDD